MKCEIEVKPIPKTDMSLFIVRQPESTTSVTIKTDIAEYLRDCVEEGQVKHLMDGDKNEIYL